MVKRASFYLSFVALLLISVIQSVLADFDVTIINRSDMKYKKIDLIFTAQGFDASYGRITINAEKIGPGQRAKYTFPCKYRIIPMTGNLFLRDDSNLDLGVMANPLHMSEAIQTRIVKEIISARPHIVEDLQTFPSQPPLRGIEPPDIKIILTNSEDGTTKIDVKCYERNE